MQTYLADIQKLIADWYLLTVDNPWYGFTTAAIVWLLSAFLYNFKIFLLNKKKKTVDKQLSEVQTTLEGTELKLKKNEETITANADQLAEHKQIIEAIEEKNKNRNQKIIDSTKALAEKFDLREQLDESDEEKQEEFIWQQQDRVIEQLSERIGIEQQEKGALEATHRQELEKFNEKEALASDLQTMLDTQAKKFSQMLTEQNSTLKQQSEEAQQQLSSMLVDTQNTLRTAEPVVPVEPEDDLIPDLIGSVTFDKEEKDESLHIKNLFGSEKEVETTLASSVETTDIEEETIPSSIDPVKVEEEKEIEAEEPFVQQLDSVMQEEQPKSIFPGEEDSEKEKNFRELKKLLSESKKDDKTKMTTTIEKKPSVVPVPRKKKVKQKSKSSFNLVKKMKGLFSKG